jgi:hypothetical protein
MHTMAPMSYRRRWFTLHSTKSLNKSALTPWSKACVLRSHEHFASSDFGPFRFFHSCSHRVLLTNYRSQLARGRLCKVLRRVHRFGGSLWRCRFCCRGRAWVQERLSPLLSACDKGSWNKRYACVFGGVCLREQCTDDLRRCRKTDRMQTRKRNLAHGCRLSRFRAVRRAMHETCNRYARRSQLRYVLSRCARRWRMLGHGTGRSTVREWPLVRRRQVYKAASSGCRRRLVREDERFQHVYAPVRQGLLLQSRIWNQSDHRNLRKRIYQRRSLHQ